MGSVDALRMIWERIPDANCKGLCEDSCGPVPASPLERWLVEEAGGELPTPEEAFFSVLTMAVQDVPMCPSLVDGQCSVYDVRPTLCRLWGSSEEMPCPHGCEPTGGRMSHEATRKALRDSQRVGQVASRRDRR